MPGAGSSQKQQAVHTPFTCVYLVHLTAEAGTDIAIRAASPTINADRHFLIIPPPAELKHHCSNLNFFTRAEIRLVGVNLTICTTHESGGKAAMGCVSCRHAFTYFFRSRANIFRLAWRMEGRHFKSGKTHSQPSEFMKQVPIEQWALHVLQFGN